MKPLIVSVAAQSGWMEPGQSQPSGSCHALAQDVTLWEGESQGICSAALKELVRIIKDPAEERCVVALVLTQKIRTLEGFKHESIVDAMFS